MPDEKDAGNGLSWRALESGCAYGQLINLRVTQVEGNVEKVTNKVDRLTWVLGGTGLSFAVAALMLALNLLLH